MSHYWIYVIVLIGWIIAYKIWKVSNKLRDYKDEIYNLKQIINEQGKEIEELKKHTNL